jgi:hypothetical protein
MSFACDFAPPDKQRVAAALTAARNTKASRREKQHSVVMSFWGFASSDAVSALVASMREAFHTQRVFCSDVTPGRFEGVVAVLRVHVSALEELCEAAKMSIGLLEMGEVARHTCLRCHRDKMHAGFGACITRIAGGSNKRGTHPVAWGPPYERFVVDLQLHDNVFKVTGLAFDANNMIMLYMAQRSIQHSTDSLRNRIRTLQREQQYTNTRVEVLQVEHNRMLFEIQQAFRSGLISGTCMHRILFSG